MPSVDDEAEKGVRCIEASLIAVLVTHLLPVQNVEASLPRKSAAPRSSSGLARRPNTFWDDHISSWLGLALRNGFIILQAKEVLVSLS